MIRRLLIALVLAVLPHLAAAECAGKNLIDALPADQAAQLRAATAAHPFAEGNLWRATRGGQVLHILGTYHLGDPRHDAIVARVEPLLGASSLLLVEAGPDEEKALMRALARRPDIMFLTEGPSLLEQLGPEIWPDLVRAMEARGIPGIMAAKMQPWYVSMLLGMPACAQEDLINDTGLDKRLMDRAQVDAVPVRALEPYDTLFSLFDSLTDQDQLSMIRTSLPLEALAEDLAVTLSDAYFREDSRLMWQFMFHLTQTLPDYPPDQARADFDKMENVLMRARNRAWIPVIEDAAATAPGPVFVAFGALHLAGQDGVLNLLQHRGFVLERLPL